MLACCELWKEAEIAVDIKTTLDVPDQIFRQAKARAALRGISLREFVTEAIQEKVSSSPSSRFSRVEPPWMGGRGASGS